MRRFKNILLADESMTRNHNIDLGLCACLDWRDRAIAKGRLVRGTPLDERFIAAFCGCSYQCISLIQQRDLAKMRLRLRLAGVEEGR